MIPEPLFLDQIAPRVRLSLFSPLFFYKENVIKSFAFYKIDFEPSEVMRSSNKKMWLTIGDNYPQDFEEIILFPQSS